MNRPRDINWLGITLLAITGISAAFSAWLLLVVFICLGP